MWVAVYRFHRGSWVADYIKLGKTTRYDRVPSARINPYQPKENAMDTATSKTKPVLKAETRTDDHTATKAKPVSPNYWASLLLPIALIAVVG